MPSTVTSFVQWTANVTLTSSPDMNTSGMYYDHYNPGTPFDVTMDGLLLMALIVSFYLLVSLCWYEILLRRSEGSNAPTGGSRFRIAPWLRILCIFSAIFSLLRCINDIVYYKTSAMGSERCTVLKNIGVSWLVGIDTTVYLFLWVRQRVLYGKKSLKHLENRLIFFASSLALFLIIIIFLVMNVALLGWRKYTYEPTSFKCKSVKNFVISALPTMWAITTSFLHVILAALYIYPLLRQTSKLHQQRRTDFPISRGRIVSLIRRNKPQNNPEAQGTSSAASYRGKRNLMDVVARCVIISLVCVITDALTIIITRFVVKEEKHTKLRHFLYNINTLINVFAIVCSFRRWDAMLLPCVRFHRNQGAKAAEKRLVADNTMQNSAGTTASMLPNTANRV